MGFVSQLVRVLAQVVKLDEVLGVVKLTINAVLDGREAAEARVAVIGRILAFALEFRQAQLFQTPTRRGISKQTLMKKKKCDGGKY